MLWVAISVASHITFDELHLRTEYMIGGVWIDIAGRLIRFDLFCLLIAARRYGDVLRDPA
jgi:hypothetical protein